MAPWYPLDALLTPWDPLAPPNRPPRTPKQVSWPHCTLKITSTALQITLTSLNPFTPPHPRQALQLLLFLFLLLLLQMIKRIRPLANDYPKDPASCKVSSQGFCLLQLIIWRDRALANDLSEGRPFANNYLEDPASCKFSYGGPGLLEIVIQRIWPLANDHLEDPTPCK